MDPAIPDINVSDLVISTAGRDQGSLYYCISVQERYVMLANGINRTMEAPKKKRLRHVQKVLRSDTKFADKLRAGDKVLNSELRKELAFLGRELQSNNLGG